MLNAPPHALADPFIPGGSIYDGTTFYQVQSILREGTFGKVAKCTRVNDNATVAVKVIKKQGSYNKAVNEAQALIQLKTLDADKCNVVHWYKVFTDKGCVFLVFEHLDKSLSDFMKQRNFCPLPLTEIRPIVWQLANALDHLRTLGLIHTDIKMENVMLVNHEKEAFRVKLIDFSLAMDVSAVTIGSNLQTPSYRSPEIILALHFTQAIDMWSLGCLAAELYLGTLLYPGVNDYDMIRYIVETQGQPPDSMLNTGQRTAFFFDKVYTSHTSPWKLKTPGQYFKETGIQPVETRRVKFSSLDGLLNILLFNHNSVADKVVEEADRLMFVDMLKAMLKLDASQRFKPCQVLDHNFIKMRHIVSFCRLSSLAHSSIKIMEVCQRTSHSSKVEVGAKEQSSTKATCPNQQEVKAPTSTANTSKPAKPKCVNTNPCTLNQSKGSVPGGTNRAGDQHDGEKTFPVPKNVSYAGPPNYQDLKSNKTHLQRPPNPLTYYGPCDKRETNGEKDNFHVKSEPKRKRARESGNTVATQGGYIYLDNIPNMCEIHPMNPFDGPSLEMKDLSQETFDGGKVGLGSFENPYIGSSHPNQQNHLPSLPNTTIAGEMRQANCGNPKPCTYSQIHGTAQPGIKTDSDHKDNQLAFLKNDKVNYERNRDDSTTNVVGSEDSKEVSHL